jgi:hypothetical protein
VSQDGTGAAQAHRLKADTLPVLSEFQSQKPRYSKILEMLKRALEHGGLAAAGRTSQEEVLHGRWLFIYSVFCIVTIHIIVTQIVVVRKTRPSSQTCGSKEV